MHKLEGEQGKTTGFIDALYGFESVYERKDFIKIMKTPRMNWAFDSKKIRTKMNDEFMDEELVEDY